MSLFPSVPGQVATGTDVWRAEENKMFAEAAQLSNRGS